MPARTATDADLIALDPCNSTPQAVRDVWRSLALATGKVSTSVLGEATSYAHALLTLHMLTTAGISGTSSGPAPTASKTIGPLSISYDTSGAKASGPHATTAWGQLLDMILEGIPTLGAVGRADGLITLTSAGPRFR